MAFEWLPGVGAAVAGSALAYWKASSVMEAILDTKVKALEANYAAIGTKLERASEQMSKAASDFSAVQASQSVINGFTTKVLDSMASKLEAHEKQISEHSSSLSLIREYVLKGHNG